LGYGPQRPPPDHQQSIPPSPLLSPYTGQDLRIPPLPHIRMALPFLPDPPHPLIPQAQYLIRDLHARKRGVVAHAREEGDTVPWARPGRALADAAREGLVRSPRPASIPRFRGTGDPFPREVLRLVAGRQSGRVSWVNLTISSLCCWSGVEEAAVEGLWAADGSWSIWFVESIPRTLGWFFIWTSSFSSSEKLEESFAP